MALVELRLSGLAVLDGVRCAPGPRLTVLTGETGSGKSLCVSGLRLALGDRVDGDPVRAGADRAVVAAVFDEVPGSTRALLEAHGIPDLELLTLSRELPAQGRGVCRINGALVAQGVLRAVGATLVEITAQGESGRLVRSAWQRSVVDAVGGAPLLAARTATAKADATRRAAEAALSRARADADADADALARAHELVEDLEPLGLRAGEDVELSGERRRLVHAAGLRAALAAVHAAGTGGEDGAQGAADLLAAAVATGAGVAGVDPAVDDLVRRAGELAGLVADLAADARGAGTAIELDSGRLVAVEERLDVLDRVRRRHGSVEEALDALAAARSRIDGREPGALERLQADLDVACRDLAEAAGTLSRQRAAAAARLEREVLPQLRALRLPHARFRVVLQRRPDIDGVKVDGERVACGPDGIDQVEMRFSAAADGVPLPLGEGVSGGELSRVALALRAVAGLIDDCPTLVLDEVDTGIGGETAARVGDALRAAGLHRQLLVVTHRAEIAARADTHVVVRRPGPGEGSAVVAEVTGAARAVEVARLLSGDATAAAVARAHELLDEGSRPAPAAAVRTMTPR